MDRMPSNETLFDDGELQALTRAALATGPKSILELDAVIQWASGVRLEAEMLCLALDGRLKLHYDRRDGVRFEALSGAADSFLERMEG